MRIGLALALFVSSGCAIWRGGSPAELGAARSDAKRILALTTARVAYELEVQSTDGGRVRGRLVRAWSVPEHLMSVEAIRAREESPLETAAHFGWKPHLAFKGGEPVELALRDIAYVRVYEPRPGRTAGIVVGGLLGAAALAFGIVMLIAVSSIKCGRPLRVRGRRVVTGVAGDNGWRAPLKLAPVPDDVRPTLAEIWREEAQAEHAAIAAFSKLSLELLALGGPPELVTWANRAAMQEVEHAKLCFAVASAYAGKALGPAPLPEALEGDTADLQRIAREALLDGCLREGLAAEVARIGAERAKDPELARVIRIQAREEAQHAALGWAIVDWCLERGGEDMRRTLLATLPKAVFPRCDDLPEHGHLGRAEVAPLFAALVEDARARLSACSQDALAA